MSPDICNLGTVTYGDFDLFIYDIINHYVTSIRNHYFGGANGKKTERERERERISLRDKEREWEGDRETEIFRRH